MSTFARLLALTCCFVSAGVSADQVPARGMLLVATDEVRGPAFAQTVVLLLQHDETGTLGLVVNRPIDSAAVEVLRQHEDLTAYHGTFYWGGPLLQSTLRALLRIDTPPDGAVQVFENVHLVNIDEALLADTSDAAILRLFMGYAGWAPGQLEYELGFDSWHVLRATEEVVFAKETGDIWRKLVPPKSYRAAADKTESGRNALISWTPQNGRSSCSGNFYCGYSPADSMSGRDRTLR